MTGQPLRAKVLTHVRCHMDYARLAVTTGADGIVLFGTSSAMRTFSHGKSVDDIIEAGTEVVRFIQSQELEVRFSSEDPFRSAPRDLLRVYQAIDRLHPQRVRELGLSQVREVRGRALMLAVELK